MRVFVLSILLLTVGLFQPVQPSDAIARAETAYMQGNYAEAIQLYNSLVDAGFRDGALYFDLANAYNQSGDLGHALLNYRRAQQFIPRDSVLNEQIALIRAGRVDIQPDESGILADLSNLTISLLTVHELLLLVVIIWVTGCALLALRILRPQHHQRLRLPIVACGVIVLIGFTLLSSRSLSESSHPSAVVLDAKVAVMSGPGEQYFNLFDLHAAAEVREVEQRGNWLWVELPDDRQGWIPTTTVEKVAN